MPVGELEIVCPHCGATEICGPAQMQARLRSLSLLRREAQPPLDLLQELFRGAASRLACHECDRVGLSTRQPRNEDWNAVRLCVDCRARIPDERVALYPDASRCAACESRPVGSQASEREFCPRCGEELRLKLARGGGLARYTLKCPRCRN